MNGARRVVLFTGDGKGKTTAALGLSMRAAGHGMRVFFIQFIKAPAAATGEAAFLERIEGIELVRVGLGWTPREDDPAFSLHVAAAGDGLGRAEKAVHCGEWGMVVLDEVCTAIHRGLLDCASVRDLVLGAPDGLIMVLTGRAAPRELIDISDTVTRMRCVRHAFDRGVPPWKGVEI